MEGPDLIVESVTTDEAQPDVNPNSTAAKKKFIAPEILAPVDVLEATTYFQVTGSGATP